MFVFGHFVLAVAKVLDFALVLFMYIVVARAVLSWVSPDPFNPIVRFIHNITEPVLYPIRTKVPLNFGGIDLSPILVFMIIIFLRTFVVRNLLHVAASML